MKHWIVATALAVAGFGCDDGGSGGGGAGGGDAGVGQGQQATGLFGRIVGPSGQPVAGATVRAGGASTTTGGDGTFQLALSAGDVTVRVEADGHLPLIRNTTVVTQAANRFEGQLIAEAPAVALDADAGGQVDGERGAQVVVPAGALVGPDGMPAAGMVDVHLTPIDPSVPAQLAGAPGALSARNMAGEPTKLESFGMLDVTMRQGDAELQVAPGQALQIQIPAPMGQGEPPAEMPLWSFDEDAGLWVQEGTLTYDAGSGTYLGEIQHMSFWNADRELETTCIKGLVTDADGAPIGGAQITSRGVDYNGMDTATARADGRFAVLARVNSRVNVLASHGGGVEREVMSGADIARQPADPDDPACVDGGTWVIERGVVQFANGDRIECDPAALQSFSGCIPLLVDLATCHNPQGACEFTGGGLAGTNYRFENGARVESDVDLDTFVVTTTYYGPGDVECGRQIINTMSGPAGSVIEVELADGRSAAYGVDFDVDSGDITYTCGDGSTRTITQDDQLALSACTGGDGAQECSGEPGGGVGGGGLCEADAECGDTQVCCGGVCIAEDLCAFGGRMCQADAECQGDDRVCCPVNGRCTDRQQCVNSGWCQGDGDCPNGICCDQMCVNDGRASCSGACEANADCGDDPERPFCCQSALREQSWCARDEFECYEFMACEADAECMASGLTCCEGECRSFGDCFGGEACEAVADCGGEGNGLLCCDSDAQGNNGQCSTPLGCYEGAPCNVADGCPGDLFCCSRFQVADGFEGACLEAEGICNFQLPCGSQAECGEGAVCCADEFLPEPQCFPADSGCANTLP